MTVAVMGCVVNGPGESKHANIGISLPGTGERPVAPVYEDGAKTVTLKGERIAEEFQQLVEQYIARTYRAAACSTSAQEPRMSELSANAAAGHAKAACRPDARRRRSEALQQLSSEWRLIEDGKAIGASSRFAISIAP